MRRHRTWEVVGAVVVVMMMLDQRGVDPRNYAAYLAACTQPNTIINSLHGTRWRTSRKMVNGKSFSPYVIFRCGVNFSHVAQPTRPLLALWRFVSGFCIRRRRRVFDVLQHCRPAGPTKKHKRPGGFSRVVNEQPSHIFLRYEVMVEIRFHVNVFIYI